VRDPVLSDLTDELRALFEQVQREDLFISPRMSVARMLAHGETEMPYSGCAMTQRKKRLISARRLRAPTLPSRPLALISDVTCWSVISVIAKLSHLGSKSLRISRSASLPFRSPGNLSRIKSSTTAANVVRRFCSSTARSRAASVRLRSSHFPISRRLGLSLPG
jgi:hypothetical protein